MILLRQRVRQFQQKDFKADQSLYEHLRLGQNPEILFITCSDSRIMPDQLIQSKPGEIFVVRNAGNIIPAYPDKGGESATIEYALNALNIKQIIVCGHSQCGAMKGLINPETTHSMPAVTEWLKNGPLLDDLTHSFNPDSDTSLLDRTIAENVLLQVEHLKQYPVIKAKLEKKELTVHAWVYTFESGNVFTFNSDLNEFEPILIDESNCPISPVPEQSTSNMNFVLNCFAMSALGLGAILILSCLIIPNSLFIGFGSGMMAMGTGYLASNSRFFTPSQTVIPTEDYSDLVQRTGCC